MADAIRIHVPPGFVGASGSDAPLSIAMRVIGLAFDTSVDLWADPSKYGAKFENDLFFMVPDYADTECDCGFAERADAWHDRNPHTDPCYRNELARRVGEYEYSAGETIRREAIARALCGEREISWCDGWGWASHCDCGQKQAWDMWAEYERHGDRCPLALPNFWFKPTGFRVRWYKYIGRDMQHNAAELPPDWLHQIFATHPTGRTLAQTIQELEELSIETATAWKAMFAELNAAPADSERTP